MYDDLILIQYTIRVHTYMTAVFVRSHLAIDRPHRVALETARVQVQARQRLVPDQSGCPERLRRTTSPPPLPVPLPLSFELFVERLGRVAQRYALTPGAKKKYTQHKEKAAVVFACVSVCLWGGGEGEFVGVCVV